MSQVSQKLRDAPARAEYNCVMCKDPECCMAHLRASDAGTGQKCDDIISGHLCQKCHDYADGRTNDGGQIDWYWKFLALSRTLHRLVHDGVITVA